MKSGIVEKKERALYKNLENLEKQKYVVYNNKSLRLTNKGQKLYERIDSEISPCIRAASIIRKNNVLRFTTKAKTVLKT